MPLITYGVGSYRRDVAGMPERRLVNMSVEAAPTSETGAILNSRTGLEEHLTGLGSEAVVGGIQADGTFSGDTFSVAGAKLYRNATAITGTITGTGPLSIAIGNDEICFTRIGQLYSYNGSNLAAVEFPDGAAVRAVAWQNGRFIALRDGTQQYYWSAINNGRSWDALDFASAESSPDPLLDLAVVNNLLLLFGSRTTEPHAVSENPELPWIRITERISDKGIIATGCARKVDNSVLFGGNDGMAYRYNEAPQRLSDHGIEERINKCRLAGGTVSSFAYVDQGHTYFALRLTAGDGRGTFQFDVSSGQWSELASHGRDNYRAQCAIDIGGRYVFGDDETGRLLKLGTGYEDIGEKLVREFSAYFPLPGGSLSVDALDLEANTGSTQLLVGQGSAPLIEMRSSRSGGRLWSTYRGTSLGEQGEYLQRAQWRRNGTFASPGGLFEFRVSDPAPLRVSSVRINEDGGGRSRS